MPSGGTGVVEEETESRNKCCRKDCELPGPARSRYATIAGQSLGLSVAPPPGKPPVGRSLANGTNNPKMHPAIANAQPAVNVATHLDDRTITRGNFPSRQRRWCCANKRALRSLRCIKVLFQISAPRTQFSVLPEQLLAHRTQTQLGFDACAQHLGMDGLGHEIICPRF